jgi:FkbM family methyltransferase
MNLVEKLFYIPDYLLGFRHGDPHKNGEYKFLRNYIKNKMTIFDVGANIGEFTGYLVDNFEQLEMHTFEPVRETFNELKRRINPGVNKSKIYFNNFGLGSKNEEKEINIYGNLSGVNSLYLNEDLAANSKIIVKESIKLSTADDYIGINSINEVHLMKIDVEGYESNVILGSEYSIKAKIIKAIQFEYGGFWKYSEKSLKDVHEFLSDYSYKIYRLTPWGKILISHFNKNLNNYKYSNYIAIL